MSLLSCTASARTESGRFSKNNIRPDDLPAFIALTHAAIQGLDAPSAPVAEASEQPEFTPAVTARKSLSSRDHIVSMIDGKPYKTLKRHLSTNGLTPAEYRQRYGLKADYPMVAPAYSETRKALAQKIGLGRKPVATAAPAAKPAKRTAKANSASRLNQRSVTTSRADHPFDKDGLWRFAARALFLKARVRSFSA